MHDTYITLIVISVFVICLILARIATNLYRIVIKLDNISNNLVKDSEHNLESNLMKKQYRVFLRENKDIENLSHKDRYNQFRLWLETRIDNSSSE